MARKETVLSKSIRVVTASAIFFTSFLLPYPVYSQEFKFLKQISSVITPGSQFIPTHLNGIKINLVDPFQLEFFVHPGSQALSDKAFEAESLRLIRYFLAALTVPEQELWVNLSPYEGDKIIPKVFGRTEMGRDLLAQDFLLKQLTAALTNPNDEVGKKFWDNVYARVFARFGTTKMPVNTFNKVWIIPDEAQVYVKDDSAFVISSRLKVMMEEDLVAFAEQVKEGLGKAMKNSSVPLKDVSSESGQVFKEMVLEEVEREVNEGETFANLRQIYQALILASWFKKYWQESLLGQMYVNQRKVFGVNIQDSLEKEKIFDQYVAAFKKGAYDFEQTDFDTHLKQEVKRRYFSGGADFMQLPERIVFQRELSSLPTAKGESPAARVVAAHRNDRSVVTKFTPLEQSPEDKARIAALDEAGSLRRKIIETQNKLSAAQAKLAALPESFAEKPSVVTEIAVFEQELRSHEQERDSLIAKNSDLRNVFDVERFEVAKTNAIEIPRQESSSPMGVRDAIILSSKRDEQVNASFFQMANTGQSVFKRTSLVGLWDRLKRVLVLGTMAFSLADQPLLAQRLQGSAVQVSEARRFSEVNLDDLKALGAQFINAATPADRYRLGKAIVDHLNANRVTRPESQEYIFQVLFEAIKLNDPSINKLAISTLKANASQTGYLLKKVSESASTTDAAYVQKIRKLNEEPLSLADVLEIVQRKNDSANNTPVRYWTVKQLADLLTWEAISKRISPEALKEIRMQLLKVYAEDSDGAIRQQARKGLELGFTNQSQFNDFMRPYLGDPDQQVRQAAQRLITLSVDPNALNIKVDVNERKAFVRKQYASPWMDLTEQEFEINGKKIFFKGNFTQESAQALVRNLPAGVDLNDRRAFGPVSIIQIEGLARPIYSSTEGAILVSAQMVRDPQLMKNRTMPRIRWNSDRFEDLNPEEIESVMVFVNNNSKRSRMEVALQQTERMVNDAPSLEAQEEFREFLKQLSDKEIVDYIRGAIDDADSQHLQNVMERLSKLNNPVASDTNGNALRFTISESGFMTKAGTISNPWQVLLAERFLAQRSTDSRLAQSGESQQSTDRASLTKNTVQGRDGMMVSQERVDPGEGVEAAGQPISERARLITAPTGSRREFLRNLGVGAGVAATGTLGMAQSQARPVRVSGVLAERQQLFASLIDQLGALQITARQAAMDTLQNIREQEIYQDELVGLLQETVLNDNNAERIIHATSLLRQMASASVQRLVAPRAAQFLLQTDSNHSFYDLAAGLVYNSKAINADIMRLGIRDINSSNAFKNARNWLKETLRKSAQELGVAFAPLAQVYAEQLLGDGSLTIQANLLAIYIEEQKQAGPLKEAIIQAVLDLSTREPQRFYHALNFLSRVESVATKELLRRFDKQTSQFSFIAQLADTTKTPAELRIVARAYIANKQAENPDTVASAQQRWYRELLEALRQSNGQARANVRWLQTSLAMFYASPNFDDFDSRQIQEIVESIKRFASVASSDKFDISHTMWLFLGEKSPELISSFNALKDAVDHELGHYHNEFRNQAFFKRVAPTPTDAIAVDEFGADLFFIRGRLKESPGRDPAGVVQSVQKFNDGRVPSRAKRLVSSFPQLMNPAKARKAAQSVWTLPEGHVWARKYLNEIYFDQKRQDLNLLWQAFERVSRGLKINTTFKDFRKQLEREYDGLAAEKQKTPGGMGAAVTGIGVDRASLTDSSPGRDAMMMSEEPADESQMVEHAQRIKSFATNPEFSAEQAQERVAKNPGAQMEIKAGAFTIQYDNSSTLLSAGASEGAIRLLSRDAALSREETRLGAMHMMAVYGSDWGTSKKLESTVKMGKKVEGPGGVISIDFEETTTGWEQGLPGSVANVLANTDLANKKVAVVGFGDGIQAIVAAKKGASVVAIDINEGSLGLAKQNAVNNNVEAQIDFVVGDALNVPSESFGQPDVLVANLPGKVAQTLIPILVEKLQAKTLVLGGGANNFVPGEFYPLDSPEFDRQIPLSLHEFLLAQGYSETESFQYEQDGSQRKAYRYEFQASRGDAMMVSDEKPEGKDKASLIGMGAEAALGKTQAAVRDWNPADFKRQLRMNWNKDADLDKAVAIVKSAAQGQKVILEVGAGDGRTAVELVKRNPDVSVIVTDIYDDGDLIYQEFGLAWKRGKLAAQTVPPELSQRIVVLKTDGSILKHLPADVLEAVVMLNFDNPIRQKVFNGLGWEQIVEKLKPAGRIIEKPFVTLPDGQFQPIYAPAAMKFVEQPSTDFLGVSLDGYTDYQRKGGKRVFVWEKAPGVQDQVNLGAEANGVVKDATGEEGPVGGINLNPELLKMLIETDASTGKIKPIAPERLKNLKFDGFRPVILRIEPIKNIPLLLGINEGQLPQRQADKNPAQKIPNDLSYALPGKWYGEN